MKQDSLQSSPLVAIGKVPTSCKNLQHKEFQGNQKYDMLPGAWKILTYLNSCNCHMRARATEKPPTGTGPNVKLKLVNYAELWIGHVQYFESVI